MRCAGTEFDPRIVEVFLNLPSEVFSGSAAVPDDRSLVYELEAAEAD
jgi:hypothetical protein